MNKLSENDNKLFYATFRVLLDYANRRFHVDDKVDFLNADTLDPNVCKEAGNKIWENPALIDELLDKVKVTDEQRELLASWKNCVSDTFIVERHLRNGSIFIGLNGKVYQVLGLYDSLEDLFGHILAPVTLRATLLPFKNAIIADGLFEVLPIFTGSGMKAMLKNTYMQAKSTNKIIRQLPEMPLNEQALEIDTVSNLQTAAMATTKKNNIKPVLVYRLKVYPQGQGRSVYRIIEICGNFTLAKLCEIILDAFNFDTEHLYEFCMDNKMYSNNSYQSEPEYGERSVKARLNQLRLLPGQKFSLHYDFGDDWMFVIRVENIFTVEKRINPKVIKSVGEIEQYM